MKLGIIGTGRMAQAIVGGLLAGKAWEARDIVGTDPYPVARDAFLALDPDARLSWAESPDGLSDCGVVLVAVKPQNIDEVFPAFARLSPTALVVSIVAGVGLARLADGVGAGRAVVRVMPNTPLLVGQGMVAWCANAAATPSHREVVQRLFSSVAEVREVLESEMDAVTALSGSGPAFFYRIIQYLEAAAIAEGLDAAHARVFATRTAAGAAAMFERTGLSADELVAQVRSKGGTTEAGLAVLEAGALREVLEQTITAAARRSRELGGHA